MSPDAWLSLALVCLLGAMSPGPSLALVLHHTLAHSPRHGLATAVLHGAGVAVYAALTVAGLGLLFAQTPWLRDLISAGGALYLLHLAARAWQAHGNAGALEPPAPAALCSVAHAGADGFLMAFLNPKIGLFFLALFSQFLHHSLGAASRALMVALAGTIDASWYSAVSLGLTRTRAYHWLARRPRLIDRAMAVLLTAIAAALLVQLLA